MQIPYIYSCIAALAVGTLCVSIASAQTQSDSQPGPKISPSPAIQEKAENPQPGAQAQQRPATNQVGEGNATLNNPSRSADDYVDWAEDLDVDASGNATLSDVAWDTQKKILYVSKDETFTCKNGSTGDGTVLIAVYGNGNTMARPVGSGWFVADLDEGECAVPEAGLYGCRFDAMGDPTECGLAVVQEDDIVLEPVEK
jgi:hypothetical protein